MTSFANRTQSTAGRRAAMGAGAGLGGFMFGGRRSHRRGFNARRGSGFGH